MLLLLLPLLPFARAKTKTKKKTMNEAFVFQWCIIFLSRTKMLHWIRSKYTCTSSPVVPQSSSPPVCVVASYAAGLQAPDHILMHVSPRLVFLRCMSGRHHHTTHFLRTILNLLVSASLSINVCRVSEWHGPQRAVDIVSSWETPPPRGLINLPIKRDKRLTYKES